MVYRSSRIKLSAGQVFWREVGDCQNPVLIFLHGSWHDGSQWEQTIEPLSRDFHCFALDLLGYGNSTALKPPTSIAIEVDCVAEFVSALKLSPVYLIGHSLGAWIAISYALKYPDLVRGIITISPEGFSLANWNRYSKLTKYLLADPWRLSGWLTILKIFASLTDGASRLEKMRIHWQFFQKFPTTGKILFSRSNKVVSSELVADRLAELRVPLSILQNDRDQSLIIEQSRAYAHAVSKAEYYPLSSPDRQQIIDLIQQFVDRQQRKIDREEFELW
jgi:pimeloyl-ACP methyl ester carboxylesterase